MKVPEYYVIHS